MSKEGNRGISMFEELIGKKVKCSNPMVISFMYPNFVFVRDGNSLRLISKPFIYDGPSVNIPMLKSYKIPYIILSPNGKYNLDDRYTLMELAFKKHNLKIKDDLSWIELLSWDEFFNIFKMVWVAGIYIPPRETEVVDFLMFILENLQYPHYIIFKFTKYSLNDVNRLEMDLLKFIHNAEKQNAKSPKVREWQCQFFTLYKQNVPLACKNLLFSNIDNSELRVFNFLVDLFLGGQPVWIKRWLKDM